MTKCKKLLTNTFVLPALSLWFGLLKYSTKYSLIYFAFVCEFPTPLRSIMLSIEQLWVSSILSPSCRRIKLWSTQQAFVNLMAALSSSNMLAWKIRHFFEIMPKEHTLKGLWQTMIEHFFLFLKLLPGNGRNTFLCSPKALSTNNINVCDTPRSLHGKHCSGRNFNVFVYRFFQMLMFLIHCTHFLCRTTWYQRLWSSNWSYK